jgi:hypothetical protein
MVVYALLSKNYLIFKYLGLPLGFLLFGGFLFLNCQKDLRDYKRGIIKIKTKGETRKSSVT